MLGRAVGGVVAPDDFYWEQSSGWLYDAILGRRVVFLATSPASTSPSQRDVYRASVRVSREGRPLAVVVAHNLSNTPLGDEGPLVTRGTQIAFQSRYAGRVSGVTAIELSAYTCQQCTITMRARYAIESFFTFGAPRSELRQVMVLGNPPAHARIAFGHGFIRVSADEHEVAMSLPNTGSAYVHAGDDNPLAADGWLVPPARQWPSVRANDWLRAAVGAYRAKLFGRTRLAPTPKPALPFGVPDPLSERPLAETVLAPDPTEQQPLVRLVAIDTGRFELRVQAGYHDPHAVTGPGGAGDVPQRERAALAAILDARGADGGTLIDRRVLVPPRHGLPTIAIDEHGRVLLGRWQGDATVPAAIRWLRQSVDPPQERGRHAGLCRTARGQLVYGWGEQVTPSELARVFARSGCVEHVPLHPTSSPYRAFDDAGGEPRAAQIARLKPSATDFLYLLRRDWQRPGALRFEPAPGEQPPPVRLPAIVRAHSERHGKRVTVWRFAADRFVWLIRPGRAEQRGRTIDGDLSLAERARALVAIGLGRSDPDNRRGLIVATTALFGFRADHGALLAGQSPGCGVSPHSLTLALGSDGMTAARDASELSLLAEAGVLRSEARRIGAARMRSALCVAADGSLFYAEGVFDNPEPLGQVLLDAGCRRVADSDRGRQTQAFLHHAGQAPLSAEYDDTVLYGLAAQAHGTARGFE